MSKHNVKLKVIELDKSQHVYQVRNCNTVLKLLAEMHSDLFKLHPISRLTVNLIKKGTYKVKNAEEGVSKHYKVEEVPVDWLPMRKPWEWLKVDSN